MTLTSREKFEIVIKAQWEGVSIPTQKQTCQCHSAKRGGRVETFRRRQQRHRHLKAIGNQSACRRGECPCCATSSCARRESQSLRLWSRLQPRDIVAFEGFELSNFIPDHPDPGSQRNFGNSSLARFTVQSVVQLPLHLFSGRNRVGAKDHELAAQEPMVDRWCGCRRSGQTPGLASRRSLSRQEKCANKCPHHAGFHDSPQRNADANQAIAIQ